MFLVCWLSKGAHAYSHVPAPLYAVPFLTYIFSSRDCEDFSRCPHIFTYDAYSKVATRCHTFFPVLQLIGLQCSVLQLLGSLRYRDFRGPASYKSRVRFNQLLIPLGTSINHTMSIWLQIEFTSNMFLKTSVCADKS